MEGGFKFSSQWILCLLAVSLLQQVVTVSAVYSMSETCAQLGESFIADPHDCTFFGYCNNSKLVGSRQCPRGYVYNSRKAQCDLPSSDVCSVANVCAYAADRSHVANPNDCGSYYYCSNKVAMPLSCPSGQIYDPRTQTCVWKARSPDVCMADSICRLVPDGIFAGDPDKCGQYILCVNGVGLPGKCPQNSYFNKLRGGCQSQNPCETPTPVGIGAGVVTTLPNNPAACAKQPANQNTWVSDKTTCMGYYVCTSSTGPGAWRKCDPGLHFDDGKCVNAYSVPCKYDRCGNMNQAFVGAVGTDCKNYLICQNQTSQAQTYTNYVGLPCPPSDPYFDEYQQRCLPTSPASEKYKLCVA